MKKLLKAKHWQLFLFFYGLQLFYQLALVGVLVSNNIEKKKPDMYMILNYSKYITLIGVVPLLILLCWFWTVGVELNDKLSKELKLQTSKFKAFLIIITLYFVTILIYIGIVMNGWNRDKFSHTFMGNETNLSMLAIFFLLNLFIFFCLLHSVYFVAKTLKTYELKKKVSFSDYIGDFFLICLLFPLGIWFIQPRINKLFKE